MAIVLPKNTKTFEANPSSEVSPALAPLANTPTFSSQTGAQSSNNAATFGNALSNIVAKVGNTSYVQAAKMSTSGVPISGFHGSSGVQYKQIPTMGPQAPATAPIPGYVATNTAAMANGQAPPIPKNTVLHSSLMAGVQAKVGVGGVVDIKSTPNAVAKSAMVDTAPTPAVKTAKSSGMLSI